jgi:5'-deoxynucleotidase
MDSKPEYTEEVEKSKNHFLAYLLRMKYINRWSLMRNTLNENIAEHSLQVAIIAHLLANIKNTYFDGKLDPDRVAAIAMYHDVNETITGDLPTPIKYFNPEIKKAYKSIEKIANEKLISMLPEELRSIYGKLVFNEDEEVIKIIKATDKLSAYIKCIEEEKAGNSEFRKAKDSIYEQLTAVNLPEVEFFMEKLIPSVSLTLDELD